MNSTARLYETALRPLTGVVDAVPDESWTRPSPCAGWSARDVLAHLIGTQRDFLTGHGIELGPAPDGDAHATAAWHDHAKRVAEAIADDRAVAIGFDGHFGPTTVGAAFERFYVWDMVVHRWDIARSAGLDAGLSEAELDRIESGADSFGDALYLDGVCRAGVDAPADSDRETRVLARLGRLA